MSDSKDRELENAKHICKEIIRTNMFNRNTDANAIQKVLDRAEKSVPLAFIEKEIEAIETTLENEYSADKVSDIFNGATYKDKFRLLGQSEILKKLKRSIENGEF